jgi:hypothetical protein
MRDKAKKGKFNWNFENQTVFDHKTYPVSTNLCIRQTKYNERPKIQVERLFALLSV